MLCMPQCDNQMEDTVMETPPRLVETDATKVSWQGHSDENHGAAPWFLHNTTHTCIPLH